MEILLGPFPELAAFSSEYSGILAKEPKSGCRLRDKRIKILQILKFTISPFN